MERPGFVEPPPPPRTPRKEGEEEPSPRPKPTLKKVTTGLKKALTLKTASATASTENA